MPMTPKAKAAKTPKAEKTTATPKTEKKAAAPKEAAPKKTAPPKAKPPAKQRGAGKCQVVYLATLKNPEKNAKEIAQLVIGQGLKSTEGTISTIRSDFIRATNFLAEQGLLKSPFASGTGS